MSAETELMTGLSHEELEALADSILAPAAQARLDELLARNQDNALSAEEQEDLDRLLNRLDQLTLLKTRARYTLAHQAAGAPGT